MSTDISRIAAGSPLRGPAIGDRPEAPSRDRTLGRGPVDGGAVSVELSTRGGEAPIDGERVADIRKAIERGTYPIVPARIADAIIAAPFLLRSEG